MLTRLHSFLRATATQLGDFIEAIVRDDRADPRSAIEVDPASLSPRRQVAWSDFFHFLATGHGLDEAARRHVEAGAERLPHHSVSGRDPP